MKTSLLFSVIALFIVQLACSFSIPGVGDQAVRRGSGNVVEREEAYTGFSELDIGHAFNVDVQQGDGYSVIIRADDNLVDDVDIQMRGDKLEIGFQQGLTERIEDATLEADIVMPALTAVKASMASHVQITGFSSSDPFSADLSSASNLRGDIESGDSTVEASSASSVELSGSGGDLTAKALGASTLDLSDFAVGDATVNASDASQVIVNVSGTLNVDASSASNVLYVGSPSLGDIELTGASTVGAK